MLSRIATLAARPLQRAARTRPSHRTFSTSKPSPPRPESIFGRWLRNKREARAAQNSQAQAEAQAQAAQAQAAAQAEAAEVAARGGGAAAEGGGGAGAGGGAGMVANESGQAGRFMRVHGWRGRNEDAAAEAAAKQQQLGAAGSEAGAGAGRAGGGGGASGGRANGAGGGGGAKKGKWAKRLIGLGVVGGVWWTFAPRASDEWIELCLHPPTEPDWSHPVRALRGLVWSQDNLAMLLRLGAEQGLVKDLIIDHDGVPVLCEWATGTRSLQQREMGLAVLTMLMDDKISLRRISEFQTEYSHRLEALKVDPRSLVAPFVPPTKTPEAKSPAKPAEAAGTPGPPELDLAVDEEDAADAPGGLPGSPDSNTAAEMTEKMAKPPSKSALDLVPEPPLFVDLPYRPIVPVLLAAAQDPEMSVCSNALMGLYGLANSHVPQSAVLKDEVIASGGLTQLAQIFSTAQAPEVQEFSLMSMGTLILHMSDELFDQMLKTSQHLLEPTFMALTNLGQQQLQQGNRAVAKRAFERVLKIDPAQPQVLMMYGDLLKEEGKDEEASALYGKIQNGEGDAAVGLQGRIKQAKMLLAKTNRTFLDAYRAVNLILNSWTGTGAGELDMQGEVKQVLVKAMLKAGMTAGAFSLVSDWYGDGESGDAVAADCMAETLLQCKLYERAEKVTRKLIDLEAENQLYRFYLASALFGLERYQDAVDEATRALSASEERTVVADLYLLKARALHKMDEPRKAVAALKRLLKLEPQNTAALHLVGKLLNELSYHRDACRMFRRAAALWAEECRQIGHCSDFFYLQPDAGEAYKDICAMLSASPELRKVALDTQLLTTLRIIEKNLQATPESPRKARDEQTLKEEEKRQAKIIAERMKNETADGEKTADVGDPNDVALVRGPNSERGRGRGRSSRGSL